MISIKKTAQYLDSHAKNAERQAININWNSTPFQDYASPQLTSIATILKVLFFFIL